MGVGDYIPTTGGSHRPKPLTRRQLQQIQAAYHRLGAIHEEALLHEEKERQEADRLLDEAWSG